MMIKYWVKRKKTIKGWLVYNTLGAEAYFASRREAREHATALNVVAT